MPVTEDKGLSAKLLGWLGPAIWAVAAGILASQLTIPLAVWCAVLAVVAAIRLGPTGAASKIRFSSFWGGLVLLSVVTFVFCWAMRNGMLGSEVLGPQGAFTLSECAAWLVLPFALVFVLRVSTLRFRSFLVLEVALVAAVLAGIFAGHRDGFINRPYFFVDPLWAQGYDPLPAFLAVGAVVAALVVVLVATQGSERRSILDIVLLLGIVVLVFVFLPTEKIKDIPKIREQLSHMGKRDKDKRPNQGHGSGKPQPGQQTESGDGKGGEGEEKDWDKTGFQDQEQPKGSNRPEAVVLLHSDHNPPSEWYYFRDTAFSQFNGQRLVHDTSGRADTDLAEYFPVGTLALPHASVDPLASQELDTTVAMLTVHTKPFGLVDPEQMTSIPNPDPKRFQRAYDVKSVVLTKSLLQLLKYDVGDPAWADPPVPLPRAPGDSDAGYQAATWLVNAAVAGLGPPLSSLQEHYLDGPRDKDHPDQPDPRYQRLLDKIFADLRPTLRDNKVAQAYAIKLWLEANGTYSLTSKHADSEDPVADFLFEDPTHQDKDLGDRTGDCVFFAHSAAYLMRAAGIPARVAAGYAVSARTRGSGSALLVRSRDSHAWPEMYVQDVGWVVCDIRPKKSLEPPEDPPDADQQQMLADMARKNGNPDEHHLDKSDLQDLLRRLLLALWHSLLPLLGLFTASMYVAKVVRRLQPYFCAERDLPVVALQAALDGLADVGRLRRYGQTREDFARAQATVAPALAELTALHLEVTMGQRPVPVERSYMLDLYRRAVGGGVRATRWYRCLIGWLNPVSWWWVK